MTNERPGRQSLCVIVGLWAIMCSAMAISATQQAIRAGEAIGVGQAWSAELTNLLALLLGLPIAVKAYGWVRTGRTAVPRVVVFGAALVSFSLVHVWAMMTLRALLGVQLMRSYQLTSASDWLFQAAADTVAFLTVWAVLEAARALRVHSRPRPTPILKDVEEAALEPVEPAFVQFPDGSRSLQVPVADLTAVRGGGNYVELILDGLPAKLVRATMGEAEAILKGHGFQRVHKSWLVVPAAVQAMERTPAGDYSLQLRGGVSAPLSRRNKLLVAEFRRRL